LSRYFTKYLDKMIYSIADLEQLSGISAHTIRIWERRYNALSPLRSAGNTRLYDDDQLRRLLNIASLNQSGLKISDVCRLSQTEMDDLIQKEIDKTVSKESHYEYYISQLIKYGFQYEEKQVEQLLSNCIADYKVESTYRYVIYPLLVRLGLMWGKDSVCPSQEHFLSNIIRQKLFSAIDSLPVNPTPKYSWLLFLPEDEDHDIGLLLASYMLRSAGHKVIYLGAKVPLSAVENIISKVDVDYALLFMTRTRPTADAADYIENLKKAFKDIPACVSGNVRLISGLDLGKSLHWLQNLSDLEQIINTPIYAS
jgi:MerR family transcriptional regulator, light-induced transcriptional regulator